MRIFPLCLIFAAAPALAAPPLQTVVRTIGRPDAAGVVPVELIVLNSGPVAAIDRLSARIAATIDVAGVESAVALQLAPGQADRIEIAAGGFARIRYVLPPVAMSAGQRTAILALPSLGVHGVAFDLPVAPNAPAVETATRSAPAAAPTVVAESLASPEADSGNAFLANLSAYEPIYGVYGPGTDTDARLQISFKYQLFGRANVDAAARSWLDGIQFAFTERLYWDLGRKSSPFHNVDYMPELFYLVPARPLTDSVSIGGQAGFRHESNGRDGTDSRSFNTIYVQPIATFPLGAYRVSVGPRLWAYVGSNSDNPDIRHYRGNTGLFAEIGRDDGLRLSTTTRLNPGSGKGAINAELSYPLSGLVTSNLNLYLFGQGFTGYGENLLDYDRRQTRLRLGIGIVR